MPSDHSLRRTRRLDQVCNAHAVLHAERVQPGIVSWTPLRKTRVGAACAVAFLWMSAAHAVPASTDAGIQPANGDATATGSPRTASTDAATANASAASTTTALPTVVVKASGVRNDTLKADTATIGPLGEMKRVDTPYTINVVPQHLIESQQLRSIQDALRYIPSVQGDGARPQSRGIQGSVVQNFRIDGLNAVSTTDYSAEEFEQIEVLNGLSGALYGPANPAGTFNFIQKRPTDERLVRFTFGYGSHDRFTRELDLSDRVGPSRALGYRLTLLDETGTGYTADSSIRRQLISMAFDFHLSPTTVIEANYTHYHYIALGLPATFTLAAGVHLPAALDPTNAAYGASNAGNDDETDTATLRIRKELTPNWHFTAGVLRQFADRNSDQPTYTLRNNAGAYTSTYATATASQFTITSNAIYLNGDVETGPIKHAISVGTSGFIWNNYNPIGGSTVTLGSGNLADPESFGIVSQPNFVHRYQSANAWQQSVMLSDGVTFTPRWSMLLSGSQSWLGSSNYGTTGNLTSSSDNNGLSGSASVMFKPRSDMTTYVTYADSLQQGDVAPAGAVNQGNILAPYRSKEWEVGYKIALQKMNVSLAAFQIKRPFAYTNSSLVYGVAGEQRNRGIELMMDGNPMRDLSLFGGVTYLDPLLFNTASASTNGKQIVGLPHWALNMLAEYHVPQVAGLSGSFNVHYISSRPTDDANTSSAAGYATFDLSAAYQTVLLGRLTTFRVGIYNLTDKRYWTNIYPGALSGYTGAGNASAQLGAPRTVQATVQFEL